MEFSCPWFLQYQQWLQSSNFWIPKPNKPYVEFPRRFWISKFFFWYYSQHDTPTLCLFFNFLQHISIHYSFLDFIIISFYVWIGPFSCSNHISLVCFSSKIWHSYSSYIHWQQFSLFLFTPLHLLIILPLLCPKWFSLCLQRLKTPLGLQLISLVRRSPMTCCKLILLLQQKWWTSTKKICFQCLPLQQPLLCLHHLLLLQQWSLLILPLQSLCPLPLLLVILTLCQHVKQLLHRNPPLASCPHWYYFNLQAGSSLSNNGE